MTASSDKPEKTAKQIAASIRQQITSGRRRPGSPLPTRRELTKQFDVSYLTIQRAFDRLSADGFVSARGARGTFVAEHPPHLCQFGLAFPVEPSISRFWSLLYKEAMRIGSAQSLRIKVYIYDPQLNSVNGLPQLLDDINSSRLAGLIFTDNPREFLGKDLDQIRLPRVSTTNRAVDDMPSVGSDWRKLLDRGTSHLMELGCRRIGVLGVFTHQEAVDEVIDLLNNRNIGGRVHVQSASAKYPCTTTQIIELMMHLPPDERPDGLLITDDHLVEPATAALARMQAEVPKSLKIVAHCNYPQPPSSCVPVIRLGYDCRQIMQKCMQILQDQRRGKKIEGLTLVPPLFEWELPQQSSTAAAEE